jgi:hypothetical protein
VREERFAGVGVHVGGGDCGGVADGLGGVFVGEGGGEVGAINLCVLLGLVYEISSKDSWDDALVLRGVPSSWLL